MRKTRFRYQLILQKLCFVKVLNWLEIKKGGNFLSPFTVLCDRVRIQMLTLAVSIPTFVESSGPKT
jgi:hypothetical protein